MSCPRIFLGAHRCRDLASAGGRRMSMVFAEATAPRLALVQRSCRVCLVTEAAGAGVGRHFLDLAAGLAARGIDVTAIYSPGRRDASFLERRIRLADVRFIELPMRRS